MHLHGTGDRRGVQEEGQRGCEGMAVGDQRRGGQGAEVTE